ncbi:MAG: DUF1566 domain-containing protein [Acidobacteria bacterium]|nr:DUF1566 domain-containing protein [Acidobacteriota bacterium]
MILLTWLLWVPPERMYRALPHWPEELSVQQLSQLLVATPVAATGQELCYNSSGATIPCIGSGQDGDTLAGEPWVSPRFSDLGDGTVRDEMTGLIWLKATSCSGNITWQAALDFCNGLASGSCGLTDGSAAGDWRMPNRNELLSLQALAYANPVVPNSVGDGQWTEGDPFTGIQNYVYWTSTTATYGPQYAWVVDFGNGGIGGFDKTQPLTVWPVRY